MKLRVSRSFGAQPRNSARSREFVTRTKKAREKLALSREKGGLKATLREFARLTSRAISIPTAVLSDLAFDITAGVHTRGVLHHGEHLGAASLGGDPKSYGTTPLSWWRQMRSSLPVSPGEAAFVDLGAGKGRVLILAARMGFKKVIGVELDPALAQQARENVERWRGHRGRSTLAGQEIDVVVQDAATFDFPPGQLVVGLFNPFGPATMEQVLRRICQRSSSEGDVYITYFYPRHADVFDRFPELVPHAAGRQWKIYRLQPAESRG